MESTRPLDRAARTVSGHPVAAIAALLAVTAIERTAEQTGGALAGSAATTAGFGVLTLSSMLPIQQFGVITALTIVYSLVAALLVTPAILHLRSRTRAGKAPGGAGGRSV